MQQYIRPTEVEITRQDVADLADVPDPMPANEQEAHKLRVLQPCSGCEYCDPSLYYLVEERDDALREESANDW